MSFSLDPEILKRYKDIALLILRYGDKELIKQGASEQPFPEDGGDHNKYAGKKAEKFTEELESLGPTFIKLGQLLSSHPEFLPSAYIKALTRLQDKVEPFSFEQIEAIIETELGVRISKGFQSFENIPLAAASIGQVHRAVLRNGMSVAVKVQRPLIRERILKDLEALEDIAEGLDKYTTAGRKFAFVNMLKEFRRSLLQELDYRLEAQNLIKLGENLAQYKRIVIPQPVDDYSSSRVLTMDYIKGTKITELSPLRKLELDGGVLAKDLFNAYLDHVLIDGFFHADPHPGNIFITDDNRLALIDLGMVARINPDLREELLKLLIYISEGKGNDTAQISLKISIKLEDYEEEKFIRDVTELVSKSQGAVLANIKMGQVVVDLTRIASETGIRMAPELTMLGKTLLNLDEVGKTLEPDFDPNAAIREHSQSIMQKHFLQNINSGNIFASIIDLKEFLQKLPARLNTLFDAFINKDFEIKIKYPEELNLMVNLQKIANRITVGLILAAIIIGAALLMRVESSFTILGYPGLAIIMFLFAAITGIVLISNILIKDVGAGKKKKKI